jgi:hypothetical protein
VPLPLASTACIASSGGRPLLHHVLAAVTPSPTWTAGRGDLAAWQHCRLTGRANLRRMAAPSPSWTGWPRRMAAPSPSWMTPSPPWTAPSIWSAALPSRPHYWQAVSSLHRLRHPVKQWPVKYALCPESNFH